MTTTTSRDLQQKTYPTAQKKARKKRFSLETDLGHNHNERLQSNENSIETRHCEPSRAANFMRSTDVNEKETTKKRICSLISGFESDLTLMHSHQAQGDHVGTGQPKPKRRKQRRFAITPDGTAPQCHCTEAKSVCESSAKCRDLSIYDTLSSYTFPRTTVHNGHDITDH